MAETTTYPAGLASAASAATASPRERHSALVRGTHWLTTLSFFLLLVSGVEILISHPRFYWGETGNVKMEALLQLPIPASRASVPTGYGFVLQDQNGWSRSLHFQSAWLLVFTGILYGIWGFVAGHFRRELVKPSTQAGDWGYNRQQQLAYLLVVFGLVPLLVVTGLAMSPGFVAAFPGVATIFGGQQSARTIHFVATVLLTAFVAGHVVMVIKAGFARRTGAMLTGYMEQEGQR